MIKLRVNPAFIFALVTTFLCLQWSSAHVHLADSHSHSNQSHEHQLQNHSHALAKHFSGHHANAIDMALAAESAHAQNQITTVELDPECSTASTYNKLLVIAILPAFYQLKIKPNTTNQKLIAVEPDKIRFVNHSPLNPRAPPVYS